MIFNTSNTIKVFVLILLLMSCKTSKYMFYIEPDWWGNRKETVGIITEVDNISPTHVKYEYVANDSVYKKGMYGGPSTTNYVVQSKYMVAYNPNNPIEHYFMYHKPVFEENDILINTVGLIWSPNLLIINQGKDTIISVWAMFKPINSSELIFVSANNTKCEYCDYLKNKIKSEQNYFFEISYVKDNPKRFKINFNKPIVEEKEYKVLYSDINRKTEKKINKETRKIGNGGVIYWSPENDPANILTTARMKDFLKTYSPRDRRGRLLDVEIKIVDYNNLDVLFER